jgi:hypothetical protein
MDGDTILVGPTDSSLPSVAVAILVVASIFLLALFSEYKRNRLRFGLRTLLTAITIAAIALGVIVWTAS